MDKIQLAKTINQLYQATTDTERNVIQEKINQLGITTFI